MPGFSVCPDCGALAAAHPARSEAPFDHATYRYRSRIVGPLARLVPARLRTPTLFDESEVPIARVETRRPPFRRLLALTVGAATLTAMILGWMELASWLFPPESWTLRFVLFATIQLMGIAALAIVAWLSPGPNVHLWSAGSDPVPLLHVRLKRQSGPYSQLEVETAEGAKVGTLRLHRVRELFFPLATARPLIEIRPTAGPTLHVRRPSRLELGWIFETTDGNVVGTYARNPGLWTRDELCIADPPPCDRRLFIAAMVVARP